MSYDKFNYSNATADEIKEIEKKSRLPDSDKFISYADRSIGTIYITGGGFIRRPFTGVGADSKFGWEELTWFKTPSRSRTFAFSNMDDIDVGLIARCEINIKYMNIQDYMDLRKILGRERHFTVEFFDIDKGDWITRDMYCSENTRSKLFTLKQSLIGVMDYSIKLVGTNLDLEDVVGVDGSGGLRRMIVTYNSGEGYGSITSESVEWGGQVKIADGANFLVSPDGKHFKHWVSKKGDKVTGCYGANQSITVWGDLDLYAEYEGMEV